MHMVSCMSCWWKTGGGHAAGQDGEGLVGQHLSACCLGRQGECGSGRLVGVIDLPNWQQPICPLLCHRELLLEGCIVRYLHVLPGWRWYRVGVGG